MSAIPQLRQANLTALYQDTALLRPSYGGTPATTTNMYFSCTLFTLTALESLELTAPRSCRTDYKYLDSRGAIFSSIGPSYARILLNTTHSML